MKKLIELGGSIRPLRVPIKWPFSLQGRKASDRCCSEHSLSVAVGVQLTGFSTSPLRNPVNNNSQSSELMRLKIK